MPREEPFFRKCCYCIPLKTCLQVWACIKSMTDVSLALFLTLMLMVLKGHRDLFVKRFTAAHMFLILIIMLVIDSVFMVVLAVGLCTNNLRALRIFQYYSFYMVFMGAACFVGFLIFIIIDMHRIQYNIVPIVVAISGLLNAGLDVCIIFTLKSRTFLFILKSHFFLIATIHNPFSLDLGIIFTLKSEMIKLRNKQQYEFMQMPTLSKEEEEPREVVLAETKPEPFQSDAQSLDA